MELQDLGAVGEFVSSICILITLAFLVSEIRATNRAALDANSHARREARDRVFASVVENSSLANAIVKSPGVDEGLTAAEQMQLTVQYFRFWWYFRDQHFTKLHPDDRRAVEKSLTNMINGDAGFAEFCRGEVLASDEPDAFTQHIRTILA